VFKIKDIPPGAVTVPLEKGVGILPPGFDISTLYDEKEVDSMFPFPLETQLIHGNWTRCLPVKLES
jgi:hypothetical protein